MLRYTVFILMGVILVNTMPAAIAQESVVPKTTLTSRFPALKGINLSPEQERQITDLTKRTIAEIESKLTVTQREQIKTALGGGNDLRTAVQSINLSVGQRMSMRGIFQSVQAELKQILTPAQFQQLEQNVRSRLNQ